MANLIAFDQFDLFAGDLNFYTQAFYDDELLEDANLIFNGVTYPDYYWVNGYDGLNDLQLEFLGTGFQRNAQGAFVAGTINLVAEFDLDKPTAPMWFVFDTSISAVALYSAALTISTADEQLIYRQALSGDDSIELSIHADRVAAYSGNDVILGKGGNDDIDGGTGVDKALFAGARSAYTITQGAIGVFTIAGPDGTDTVRSTEFAAFADQTIRLLPGTGTTVNFQTDAPSTYMAAIRDFDGNNLGAAAGWVKIGAADINGDGDTDQVFANRTIGRFAEVGTAADGKVYFSDHGWAGETRVVGIYVDPLVQSGQVVAGGPNDSQRRFQNDLTIGNIKGVLGAGDYDRNGLQEVYFSLTDGTAFLHAYMHADGNIQYANYQSQQQVIDYLTQNNWAANTYAGWFG